MNYGYLRKFRCDLHFAKDYQTLTSKEVQSVITADCDSDIEIISLLKEASRGDKIITTSPSRLASSAKQLEFILRAAQLKYLKIDIGKDFSFDFLLSTNYNPSIIRIVSSLFATLEKELEDEKQEPDVHDASPSKRRVGRPVTTIEKIPSNFIRHYQTFKSGKINISEYARLTQLSRPTIYKYLKMLGNEQERV